MIRTALVLGLLMAGTAAAVTVPLPPERPGAERAGTAAIGVPTPDVWPDGASAPLVADPPERKAPTGAGPTDARAPAPKRPVLSDSKLAPVIARAPTRRGGPVAVDVPGDAHAPAVADPVSELLAAPVLYPGRDDRPDASKTAPGSDEPSTIAPKSAAGEQQAVDRAGENAATPPKVRSDPERVVLPGTKPTPEKAGAPPLPRKRPGDRARLGESVVRIASATPIAKGRAKKKSCAVTLG